MTISDTQSSGRAERRPRVLVILSAVAAAAVSVVLMATPALAAGPDAGAPATSGPGGTLDVWCTAHGGGMQTMADGTEQCNGAH